VTSPKGKKKGKRRNFIFQKGGRSHEHDFVLGEGRKRKITVKSRCAYEKEPRGWKKDRWLCTRGKTCGGPPGAGEKGKKKAPP